MRLLSRLLVPLVALYSIAACSPNQPEERSDEEWKFDESVDEETTPLLLVGLDGFKPSYLDGSHGDTPNLDRLREKGVWAESLQPVFPTHTFPNLYSAVTGLYPENHGILANTVYDPDRDVRLTMSNSEEQQNPSWWGGEPIWVTAEKQGLTAATFFWVGSEAPIQGVRPTHWMEYDSRIRHSERTDQVVQWLVEDGVDFATLYFASPDGTGHRHGPNAPQMTDTVENMDHQIGRLIEGLEEGGLWPEINVLIISDHGMVGLDEEKVIFLDDIIDLSDVHVVAWSPVAMIAPRGSTANAIYDQLVDSADNYEVYRRDELPERYRLKESDRLPEIIVVAEKPYTLTSRSYFEENGLMAGGHGFDPEYPSMHGIFLGIGPDLPSGRTTETLKLVDLYALMTHLLGLEAAEHDGSLERITDRLYNRD